MAASATRRRSARCCLEAQDNIDSVLPRPSLKPAIEVLTTNIGFGQKPEWDAATVLRGMDRGDRERAKTAELYSKVKLIVGDEAAQVDAAACSLAGHSRWHGLMRGPISLRAYQGLWAGRVELSWLGQVVRRGCGRSHVHVARRA